MIKFRKIEKPSEEQRKEAAPRKAVSKHTKKTKKAKPREARSGAGIAAAVVAGEPLGKLRYTKAKRAPSKSMEGGPNRMLTSKDYETK